MLKQENTDQLKHIVRLDIDMTAERLNNKLRQPRRDLEYGSSALATHITHNREVPNGLPAAYTNFNN